MEGPKNSGLHVPHLFEQMVAEFVQVLFGGGAGIFGHVCFLSGFNGRVTDRKEVRHRLLCGPQERVA
jgi:hypothetical protein